MKITAIPQFARNLNRAQEVVRILSKYGLADWLSQLNIGFGHGLFRGAEGDRLADVTREARVRLALTELGTTFIKLGQILSTRADLVGLPLAVELSKLQADVPADKPETVRATIEKELRRKVDDVFETFDDVPLASASIAQVHRATLPGGRPVVVKVQHPNIADRIQNDLEIVAGLAELAEKYVQEVRLYQPKAIAAEFSRTLTRELDFGRELRNLDRFIKNFKDDPTVRFPRPYPEYSTGKVLVMDLLEGTPVALAGSIGTPEEREELARKGARVFLAMIFRDGFFHADPHPGNWLVQHDGVAGLLDVGMVCQLTPTAREEMEELIISLGSNDAERLTAALMHMCGQAGARESPALTADVADFLGYHFSQPLDKLSIGSALNEITDIIRRHHLILPTNIAMILRVLVLLEGTSRLLNPTFQLTEIIQPFQRKMLTDRLSPRRQVRRLRSLLADWQDLIGKFPDELRDMIQQARSGRIEVQLEHHHLEPAVNRLVLGLITASLVVGSSMLWALKAPPTIQGVSVIAVLGFGTSILCTARLMIAIFRSRHLD